MLVALIVAAAYAVDGSILLQLRTGPKDAPTDAPKDVPTDVPTDAKDAKDLPTDAPKDGPDAKNATDAKPPSKRVAACKGSADGAECSVENRKKKKVEGVCAPQDDDPSVLECSLKPPAVTGPPPEAFAACKGSAAAANCSFVSEDLNATGKCTEIRGKMLCRPQTGATKAALEACAKSDAGANCTWTNQRGVKIQGRCREKGPLKLCAPSPPAASLDACKGKEKATECSFEFGATHVEGTCQTIDEEMVCRPAHTNRSDVGPNGTVALNTTLEARKAARTAAWKASRQAMEEACANASAGDTCTFTGLNGDVEGTCKGKDDKLACRKPREPPQDKQGHEKKGDEEAGEDGEDANDSDTAAADAAQKPKRKPEEDGPLDGPAAAKDGGGAGSDDGAAEADDGALDGAAAAKQASEGEKKDGQKQPAPEGKKGQGDGAEGAFVAQE